MVLGIAMAENVDELDNLENIHPSWHGDYFDTGTTSTSAVAPYGDVMVTCEKHSSGNRVMVREIVNDQLLWEKEIGCDVSTPSYLEISDSGDYFTLISTYHDGERNWYRLQLYNIQSSDEIWSYDFEWGNQPYMAMSGNGNFISVVTQYSGLIYFEKASNEPLWESSPLSDYQEEEVTSMGHSFQGMSMSYDGKVVVSTGSAIHYFEHPYQYPLWSKDFHLEGYWPTVLKAKISSDGQKIAYKYGTENSNPWGDPYLEEVFAISNDDGVVIFSHSAETQFSHPSGIDMVHISGDGSTTIYATRDPESGTQSVLSAVYSEEGFVIETKGIPRTSTSSDMAFMQLHLSQNGKYTFVGNDKVMLMLDADSLSSVATLSPFREEHNLENVDSTQFSYIQSSNDGNFVFTQGRYFYRTGNSASDVETVYFTLGFFTGRSDADNDGVEDVYDDCPNTEEYPILDGLNLLGCSWGQLDYDNDGANNSVDIDIFDPALSLPPEGGAGYVEWRGATLWEGSALNHGKPSMIDINNDGSLEVLFVSLFEEDEESIFFFGNTPDESSTTGLLCDKNNDKADWTCDGDLGSLPPFDGNSISRSSFDLDLDGDNEIVIGSTVLYNVGEPRWYYQSYDGGMGQTLADPSQQRLTTNLPGCTFFNTLSYTTPLDFDRDGTIELFCNDGIFAISDSFSAEQLHNDWLGCAQPYASIAGTSPVWAYEEVTGNHLISCETDTGRMVTWLDGYTPLGSESFEEMSSSDGFGAGGLADLNGDGWIDHIHSRATGECMVYLGTGDGFSDTGISLGNFLCSRGVQFIDLDGDGDLDISSSHSFVFNENGTYIESIHYGLSELNWYYGDFIGDIHHTMADVDGDGDLDRITNGGGWTNLVRNAMIFYNPWFPDEDGDGVADSADLCPSTGGTETADSNGCSPEQLDSDGDGVMNSIDACPETLSGDSVDQNGCSAANRDSDQDGMVDSIDQCPDTPPGSTIDLIGCAEGDVPNPDSDGDGVRDSDDSCPGSAEGSVVDSQGCALSQGDVDTGGENNGGGTSEESSETDDSSISTMFMTGCIAIIALLALSPINTAWRQKQLEVAQRREHGILVGRKIHQVWRENAPGLPTTEQYRAALNPDPLNPHITRFERGLLGEEPVQINDYKQAQRLQKTLDSAMQENDGLRREREELTRLLQSSDLTDTENRSLRKELSTMHSVMAENDELARVMVAELEELRAALAEERAAAKEASAEYQDSVHQGDNVGQKVESQTINDADAIARIALESYKQALKDMDKDD